jgi:p-aminobenzoyl-glutamate transporter AbgT
VTLDAQLFGITQAAVESGFGPWQRTSPALDFTYAMTVIILARHLVLTDRTHEPRLGALRRAGR